MALTTTYHAKIKGIAACVPREKICTKDYKYFNESERDLFIKSVGIIERRVAPPTVATSDLCFAAAEKLIEKIHWNKEEIDCLIFVSQ